MAKRIVNKAERNAERYDAKETGYRLFEDSQNGKTFDRLMPLIWYVCISNHVRESETTLTGI